MERGPVSRIATAATPRRSKSLAMTTQPAAVIIVDIDEVFAGHRVRERYHGTMETLDPEGISQLNRLCRDAGACVVISSTWRKTWNPKRLLQHFRKAGFTGVFHADWRTPISAKGFRGDEVDDWLRRHPEVTAYVIIDDSGDFHPHQPLVRIRANDGFTEERCARAHLLLAGKDAQ